MSQERVLQLPDAAGAVMVAAAVVRVVDAWNVTSAIRRAIVRCDPRSLPSAASALVMNVHVPDGGEISGVARIRRRAARSVELTLDYADPGPGRVSPSQTRPPRRLTLIGASTVEPLPPVSGRHVLVGEESTLPLLAARARTAPRGAEVVSFVRSEWSDTWDYVDPDDVAPAATWCPARPNGSEVRRIAESIGTLGDFVQIWAAGDPKRVGELHRSLVELGIRIEPPADSGAGEIAGVPVRRVA